MGVAIGDIVEKQTTELSMLSGRKIAVDAYNTLYQFLSIIRQPDGTPLMDSRGRITSHLTGLFYRTVNLIEKGINPVFVFDGKPPDLKKKVLEQRNKTRRDAKKEWEKALKAGDLETARTKAQASSRLTPEMVADSEKLLDAMGVPWIEAPQEGEAQASIMTKKEVVWGCASQDYDSLLFGSPILVRNMTVTGRRKLPKKNIYVEVKPETIRLKENLERLGISREQLVEIGLMVGTDYNEGIKGIGPKKALELVKKGVNAEQAYRQQGAKEEDLGKIREIFLNPKYSEEKIGWNKNCDKEKVFELLCDEHSFSRERVENNLERLVAKKSEKGSQSRLDAWF